MNTNKVLALAREADLTRKDLAGKEHVAYEQYITPYLVKFAALLQQQMEAENAELRKDAERLDWIDTLSSSGLDHIAYGDYRYYVHGKGYRKVREVVDEAMSKERK